MTDRPLCVDLFCGYGGWARGFLDAGYRVIGFDNEPKCAKRYPGEFVLADVRSLDGARFRGARVIVASPPCTEFSTARLGRGDIEKGLSLVREAFRVIREAQPEAWAVENVAGSVKHIRLLLGEPQMRKHSYYLWGDFPGFLLPSAIPLRKGMKGRPDHKRVGRMRLSGSGDPQTRALIPYPLARALAEACLP